MLYIVSSSGAEWQWHVGARVPEVSPNLVAEIQADGDELNHIQRLFGASLPTPKTDVASWRGDLAQTIYVNLGKTIRG